MTIRIFKTFIILLILGMIIPIYLFNDNTAKNEAVEKMDYAFCNKLNYEFVYYQCLNSVQQAKLARCVRIAGEDSRVSCQETTLNERNTILEIAKMRKEFSFWSYSSILISVFYVIVFLFFIKGRWIKRFPKYDSFLSKITEVFPESDYFARQSFLVMSSVILMMGIGMVIIFEALAFFYK